MKLHLYNLTCENIVLDKSNYLTNELIIEGTFRDSVNLFSPSILIEFTTQDVEKIYDNLVQYLDEETVSNIVIDKNNLISDFDDKSLVTLKQKTTTDDEDYLLVTLEQKTVIVKDYLYHYNYLYIEEINKYYFITNITIQNNKLVIYECSEDVLMTFKDEILNIKTLVTRNEKEYDVNIVDDKLPLSDHSTIYESIIKNADLPYGTITILEDNDLFNTEIPFNSDSYNVVVSVTSQLFADNVNDETVIPTYLKNNFSMNNITYGSSGTKCSTLLYLMNPFVFNRFVVNNVIDIYDAKKYDSSYVDYIKAMTIFPFTLEGTDVDYDESDKTQTLYIGKELVEYSVDNHKVKYLTKYNSDMMLLTHFAYNPNVGEALNRGWIVYSPYTKYELYLPYYGYVTINAQDIVDCDIRIYYIVNYTDGSASCLVYSRRSKNLTNTLLYNVKCQLGIKLGITNTNQIAIENEKEQIKNNSLISGLVSIIGGTLGGALMGGGVPGAIAGFALGSIGAVTTSIKANTQVNSLVESGSTATNGGYDGLYTPQKARLKITYQEPLIDKDTYLNQYAKIYGLPLHKIKTLSEMTGYTVCDNFHLDNFDLATTEEKNKIDNLLRNGIII